MTQNEESEEVEGEEGELDVPKPELPDDLPEDEKYLALLMTPLKACAQYKPKFGRGGKTGMSYEQFQEVYAADPFYSWIGLDSPLMYAAHKAAGGMTSVYRQLGMGSQWILNQVIQDHLGLTKDEANWSYKVPSTKGKTRTLSLDGRIELDDIKDTAIKARMEQWLGTACIQLQLPKETQDNLKGIVIEARQGYKSKDAKRQNADISNAANAYANLYVPVLVVFSSQIDGVLVQRYTEAQWLLLRGTTNGTTLDSTYVFCREVVGYDLGAFFERNSPRIKQEIEGILEALLNP
jgi:hypothetical protein